MKFVVIWSDFAESQLDQIFEYYVENASLKIAKNLLQILLAEPSRIMNNPEMLQIEELLIDRPNEYRYIVTKNYKIIYSIDYKLQLIKIADVLDTRQNPTKIKRTR